MDRAIQDYIGAQGPLDREFKERPGLGFAWMSTRRGRVDEAGEDSDVKKKRRKVAKERKICVYGNYPGYYGYRRNESFGGMGQYILPVASYLYYSVIL